jgi:nucleotide-binding universal stress UspA family protein
MFEEIVACLDGSPLAEKILPLARGLTAPRGKRLTLLRIVQDTAELAAAEEYLRDRTRRYGSELHFHILADAAAAITAELERGPRAIPALTTHGRNAWTEATLGGIALRVIREAKRPVIVFCPLGDKCESPKQIGAIALALDGSCFSEKMIPYAVKAAQSLSVRLILLQALPIEKKKPSRVATDKKTTDALDSSYLQRKAAEIGAAYGIEAQWELLRGHPADAICRYLSKTPETMLAMTTHGHNGVERSVLGSVAGACVQRAGVPLLLYWPR